jgi:hypothetical protein
VIKAATNVADFDLCERGGGDQVRARHRMGMPGLIDLGFSRFKRMGILAVLAGCGKSRLIVVSLPRIAWGTSVSH